MNTLQQQYAYPLCIQLTVPDSIYHPEFLETLSALKECGFYGVELNALDFKHLPPEELKDLLAKYELRLTMVASGAHAQRHGLSLSHENDEIRLSSVQELREMIDFASALDAGVVCGFIKGDSSGRREVCKNQMKKSLKELQESGYLKKAPLYMEATNHYEALLANTLEEAAELSSCVDGELLILPDLYHMNIEEKNIYASLRNYAGLYHNVHFSDNNRYYPGFGSIDFLGVLRFLKSMDYQGTISFEGRNFYSVTQDARQSAQYIKALTAMI